MVFYVFLYLLFSHYVCIHSMDELTDSFDEFSMSEEIYIDTYSKFPLHDAVGSCDVERVKRYMHNDFDCNLLDEYKETPLHITRFIEDKNVRRTLMALLLHYKADPNIRYFYLADHCRLRELNISSFLLTDKIVLLNHYIKENSLDEVKLLLKHKADPILNYSLHETVRYQWNPLQLKSSELIALVLKHSADVNQRNTDGDTPLHRCIKNSAGFFLLDEGFLKFKTLLIYNADIGLQDNYGNTIFHQENFWQFGAQECFKEAQEIIRTLFIIKKIQESFMKKKIPKPILFSIIELANPCYKIFINPSLNAILHKKNKEDKTAYDCIEKQYIHSEKESKGNYLTEFCKQKKACFEKIMPYLKPRDA